MAEKDNQEIAFKTEEYPIPKFLYKYCRLNEDTKTWIQRIFTHNEIYFASPMQFNDPFDCKVQASFDATDDDWEDYLNGVLKDRHPEWEYDERQAFVDQLMRGGWREDPGTKQKIINEVQQAVNKCGVFCLSEVRDNILMWSHYADGHRGFGLQFHIDPKHSSLGRSLHKVEYTSTYPQINVVKAPGTQTGMILLTKSDFWKYEKEWRIIDDNGPGIRVFPAEMLTGVIFGCEMPHESRQLIREWAKDRKVRLNFYQTTKKEKEFGLEIIKAIS